MLQAIYYLETKDRRKDGRHPLKVRIYRSRTDFVVIGLKIYLLPVQWDGDKAVNSPDAQVINSRLNFYRLNIGKVLLDIDTDGGTASMSEIRNRISQAIGQKIERPASFYAYFEDYITKIVAKKTRESFQLALSKCKKYDPVDKGFPAITAGWLRGFERFCREYGLSINATAVYLRNIRIIYNRAIDDNIAQLNDYPFRRFKIRSEKTRKRALTIDQVKQLRDYPCEEWQRQYRDIFMLILYLRGINLVDLFGITKIDDDGYIYYSRSKTRKPYAVKVEPEALAIIKRYKGRKHLLSCSDRYKSHENFLRRLNRALKSIGPENSPLFPNVSSYWARHSWATIAAGLDIPKETIAAGLGHEIGSTITSIYIDFDQRKIDEANRRVIDALS